MKIRNVIVVSIIAILLLNASSYNPVQLGLCEGLLKDTVPTQTHLEQEVPEMYSPAVSEITDERRVKIFEVASTSAWETKELFLVGNGWRRFWTPHDSLEAMGTCTFGNMYEIGRWKFLLTEINPEYK